MQRKTYSNLAFTFLLQNVPSNCLIEKSSNLILKAKLQTLLNLKGCLYLLKVIAIIKLTENTHVRTPIFIHAVLIMEAFLLNITDSLKRLCGRVTEITPCPQRMQKGPKAYGELTGEKTSTHTHKNEGQKGWHVSMLL